MWVRSAVAFGASTALCLGVVPGHAVATGPADAPIGYALSSDHNFVSVAAESSKNLCQNVTKGMSRCITVSPLTQRTSPSSARNLAARTTAKPRSDSQAGTLIEPDCDFGFIRWNSCSIVDLGYDVWEVVNGVPTSIIGWMDLSFHTRVGWDYLSLNWSLRNTLTTVDAWGTEAAGPVFGGVSDGCIADPLVCDSLSGGSYSVDLERGKSSPQSWEQHETGFVSHGGSSVNLAGYVGAWLVVEPRGAPGQTVSLNSSPYNGIDGRCDRVVRATPGCVAAENWAPITYDSTAFPLVTEVAQHIYDAEASLPGNPGWLGRGTALTLGDAATENANRAVACPPGGTPPGLSCDEYPIARAREGAASGRPYSVRYVSPSANSSQGGQTSAYIGYGRIMLNEQFWVLAILPDGRDSWDR